MFTKEPDFVGRFRTKLSRFLGELTSKWEIIHNPLGGVFYLCCMLYITITYTGLVSNSEKQFIVQYTVISVITFSLLFLLFTKTNIFFFKSKKYIFRFVELFTSIFAYITIFCFSLYAFNLSEGILNIAFVIGLSSSFPLLYLLMRDGVIPRVSYETLRRLLNDWLRPPNQSARIFSPILNKDEHFDFIFSLQEIKKASTSIKDPIAGGELILGEAAYFLRSNAGSDVKGGSEFRPATSSAIEGLSHRLNTPISQSTHTNDVENHTLSQLLFLHIFRNPKEHHQRWTSNSAISLASRNKPSIMLIGDSNINKPDRIVHYWTFEQLSSAATILYHNLEIHAWNHPSKTRNMNHWLKYSLGIIGDDAPSRSGKLEQNKIYYYLAILSKSGSLEFQQNPEKWKGMIEGYCAGSEFSIGDVTTDKQILQKKIQLPSHETMRKRIDIAFQNPIDQFVKTHDDLLELFDYDKRFDEKESNYIDGVIEKMMERLHRTTYLERQVKRGNRTPESLIDRREGIIAGITVSILVVMDSLKVPE